MVSSSQTSDVSRDVACAMLQLLFLIVHSLADHSRARQLLVQMQSSTLRTSTKWHASGSGTAYTIATELPMHAIEETLMNLRTHLSESLLVSCAE